MTTFTGLTVTSTGAALPLAPRQGPAMRPHQVTFDGVFGGATASLEMRRAGQTEWISLADDTLCTGPSAFVLYLTAGDEVRVAITGATGTTAINARIV